MIKSYYDSEHNTVIIEFEGVVNASEAENFHPQIQKLIPAKKGFRILTDFTLLEGMDYEVLHVIKKNMDFLNQQGIAEVIRVIPKPENDFGFNILSIFHYSKDVRIVIFKSRAEADARFRQYAPDKE